MATVGYYGGAIHFWNDQESTGILPQMRGKCYCGSPLAIRMDWTPACGRIHKPFYLTIQTMSHGENELFCTNGRLMRNSSWKSSDNVIDIPTLRQAIIQYHGSFKKDEEDVNS